jgi:hypothetical protein
LSQPAQERTPPEARDTDEGRARANLAAGIFIVVLLVGAYVLFRELERYRETDNCIASGRRDCIPLPLNDAKSR